METYKLAMEKRIPGKKEVKATRNSGYLPIEIYGKTLETNISASVIHKDMVKALHTPMGRNVVFELDIEGTKVIAIPCDIQIDPVKNRIRHIDFKSVSPDEDVDVIVPIFRSGRSLGEVAGGKVFQVLNEVKVRCKPANIPANITIDITNMEIGDRLKVSTIPYPDGVKPVFVQDTPVIVLNKGRGQDEAK